MTVLEAARALRQSRAWVYDAITRGRLAGGFDPITRHWTVDDRAVAARAAERLADHNPNLPGAA